MDITNSEGLKLLILNSSEPLLFKRVYNASVLLKWTLKDWETKLEKEILEYRLGRFKYTHEPQWERKTEIIKSSFKYFTQCSESEENWLYFDYKYLNNWFTNVEELRKNISWAPLGFPHVTVDDCTMWMGTKGAHTPCHIDTYGFNLIFQVYGRKLWIVAPPEENLKPTRVPYEESSIYSKLNFFSPTIEDFKGVSNCRKIILNPGDVLYLPHKWWHYVENLETAISINVWVPVPQDDEERLRESIVQIFVKQMVEMSNKDTTDNILNPNMQQSILNSDFRDMLAITNKCKKICKDKSQSNKRLKKDSAEPAEDHCKINVSELLEKYDFVEKIPTMSQEDFHMFLERQSNRFKEILTDKNTGSEQKDLLELLSVFTDNDVVSLITDKLLHKTT